MSRTIASIWHMARYGNSGTGFLLWKFRGDGNSEGTGFLWQGQGTSEGTTSEGTGFFYGKGTHGRGRAFYGIFYGIAGDGLFVAILAWRPGSGDGSGDGLFVAGQGTGFLWQVKLDVQAVAGTVLR